MTTRRDSQRQKVYQWERGVAIAHSKEMFGVELSTEEAAKFATKIWNKYKNKFCFNFGRWDYCSKVKVKKVSGHKCCMKSGFYFMDRNRSRTKDGKSRLYKKMHLTLRGHTKHVVLHEIAHALAPTTSLHDKYFVGIYMYLMSKYLNFNMQWMINNANDWGVEFTFKNGDPYYSVRQNAGAKSGYLQEKVKQQLK
jgi:hypothetical protein